MNSRTLLSALLLLLWIQFFSLNTSAAPYQLSALEKNQKVVDFRVGNLYSDLDGKIVGAKFLHVPTGAPVFVFQIETVPQVFMWVDTPTESDQGLAHALEHLLAFKGRKGRYVNLLTDMRLSQSTAITVRDFNFYAFSSGTGMGGFLEQLHAWLDALYRPDFTDLEAEREFYHFGVASDPRTKERELIEEGSVYEEKQTGQGTDTYYFELLKQVLGRQNPFALAIGGVPDAMRSVTPQEIRRFHNLHYHLGPTTGFIVAVNPNENVRDLLQQISNELLPFSQRSNVPLDQRVSSEPKYPIHPSANTEPKIYPLPSSQETSPGAVRFGWKPIRCESLAQLKLLQLLFRAVAQGQQSLLYRSLVDSKTRELESGARNVESFVYLQNSPYFPFAQIEISGIPGNRISSEQMERLRSHILAKIREIAQYPDNSDGLRVFNSLVVSYAQSWQRSENIWIKNPPLFGVDRRRDWKEHLEYLEMDDSFVRSLSEDNTWEIVRREMNTGSNVWRDVIQHFALLEPPYVTASKPSQRLLEEIDKSKQARIRTTIDKLRGQYRGARNDQQALEQFEQDEMRKTAEIDKIEAEVVRPHFTDHPPLTLDDDIRYRQFRLAGVPVIASIFDRPPTIELRLAFDLRKIPRRYYKYLPIIPRCFDSLGLKKGEQVVLYSDLTARIQRDLLDLTIRYEEDAPSERAELVLQASATNLKEFRAALLLIGDIVHSSYLDVQNVGRLRDLVAQRIFLHDSFIKRDEDSWIANPAYSFRYQGDPLFMGLYSEFTRAHWDDRLRWLLHPRADERQTEDLRRFAERFLSRTSGISAHDVSEQLQRPDLNGLERELIEYWERNLPSIPAANLQEGLRRLTREVQDDLRTGSARTIADLKDLMHIVLSRRALHIDLTLNQQMLDAVSHDLDHFIKSIPVLKFTTPNETTNHSTSSLPIVEKIEKRQSSLQHDFPWYVGFANPDSVSGSVLFYADFPGYLSTDHQSLIKILSSKLFSGTGPESIFIKTREVGLAYGVLVSSDSATKLLSYYADRSPDIPSTLKVANSVAARSFDLQNQSLLDYALRQTFAIPRSIYSPSQRAAAIAQDIREGNQPEKIRRFSEAVLKLKHEPNLLSDLTREAVASICGVLLEDRCKEKQRRDQSTFFFFGSEKMLSDIEQKLPIPKLLRLWPSDFWID